MPKNISRDEALKIALRHLVAEAQKRYVRGLAIHDRIPDGLPLYLPSHADRENCWCICVPQYEGLPTTGPSRYICISKQTGEVIFDGWAGE